MANRSVHQYELVFEAIKMAMLLGKKIGMTRLYDEGGNLVPATVVQAGPCIVTQVKTIAADGYNAVQIGFQDTKPSRQTKPLVGHCEKAGTTPKQFVREIRLGDKDTPDCQAGDALTVDVFNDIKTVDVVGTSKGKGFAGPMKRHGFGVFRHHTVANASIEPQVRRQATVVVQVQAADPKRESEWVVTWVMCESPQRITAYWLLTQRKIC